MPSAKTSICINAFPAHELLKNTAKEQELLAADFGFVRRPGAYSVFHGDTLLDRSTRFILPSVSPDVNSGEWMTALVATNGAAG